MNAASEKRPLGTRWCKTGIVLAILAMILTVSGLGGGVTGALPPITAFMAFGIGGLFFFFSMIASIVGLALSKGSAGDASAAQTLMGCHDRRRRGRRRLDTNAGHVGSTGNTTT